MEGGREGMEFHGVLFLGFLFLGSNEIELTRLNHPVDLTPRTSRSFCVFSRQYSLHRYLNGVLNLVTSLPERRFLSVIT